MARSVPYTLTSARRCTLFEALLLLLLGAGLSWVSSALDGTDLPAADTRLLADVARFAVMAAVAGVVIAWGLGRAHAWAVVAGVLFHGFIAFNAVVNLRGGLDRMSGAQRWIAVMLLLVPLYALFRLLSPLTLAAAGLWRRQPRAADPSPYNADAGYQPPSRW